MRGCCGSSHKFAWSPRFGFSQQPKFKVVDDPKEAHKLVFDHNGKCRIYEHKNGER